MEIVFLYLVIVSVYDYRGKSVPGIFLLLGGVVFGIWTFYKVALGETQVLPLFLGMLPGTLLLLMAWITKKAGYADGILLILLGTYVGYQKTVIIVCFSLVIMAILSCILLMLHKVQKQSKLPYLPAVTLAFLMVYWM